MSDEQQIRRRIDAFVRDYYDWGRRFPPLPVFDGDKLLSYMDQAKDALQRTSARHCTPGDLLTNPFSGVGDPPKHQPAEKIVSIQINPDSTAVVETELKDRTLRDYHVFSLRKVDAEWRIARIETFLSPRNKRSESDPDLDELARFQPSRDPAQDFPEGLERLFDGPARLRSRDELVETEIVQAGNFDVASGFIVGDDPGYWQSGAAVFELRVPFGRYPVELVVQKKRGVIGASRIIFNRTAKVATRVYARRHEKQNFAQADDHRRNSYIIGIDGGVLGLADARDVIALTTREREEFYNRMVDATRGDKRKGYWFVNLSGNRTALVIHTGHGDGGYPAYWLLDAEGRPVSLVFDFVDLGEHVYETVKVTLESQLLDGEVIAPELAARHISVAFTREHEAPILDITADGVSAAILSDRVGNVIANSESAGSREVGKTKGYYLPKNLPKRLSGRLEIQIYRGHRYHFLPGK